MLMIGGMHRQPPRYFDSSGDDSSDGAAGATRAAAPSSDSVLLSLVQSYNWAAALARISSHPSESRVVGMEGRTPLHIACDHDAPAVVIQALLKAYPEGSTMVGTSNMNPLHITCSSSHASVHVIRVLLEGGVPEQTSMRDVDGDTPLHAACRCGAPVAVLEVLLRANASVVYERDYEGLTPLLRLWVRYFVILGSDAIEGIRGPADLTGELGEAWNKTELLLRCAHHGTVVPEQPNHHPNHLPGGGGGGCGGSSSQQPPAAFRALHAASAVDCPRQVVKIAATCYPHQIGERDENGLTPLLIAAQAPVYKARDLSGNGYTLEDMIHGDPEANGWANNGDDSNNAMPPDGYGMEPSVIEILLHANQEVALSAAGVPDPLGRLPLHLALSTGKRWTEGVKDLVEVFPDALRFEDGQSGLHPFMSAAEGRRADLVTTYELLRFNPGVLDEIRSRQQRQQREGKGGEKMIGVA